MSVDEYSDGSRYGICDKKKMSKKEIMDVLSGDKYDFDTLIYDGRRRRCGNMPNAIELPNKEYQIQVSALQNEITDLDEMVEFLTKKKQKFVIAEITTKQPKRFVIFRALDGTEPDSLKFNVKYKASYYIIDER